MHQASGGADRPARPATVSVVLLDPGREGVRAEGAVRLERQVRDEERLERGARAVQRLIVAEEVPARLCCGGLVEGGRHPAARGPRSAAVRRRREPLGRQERAVLGPPAHAIDRAAAVL